ncbi:MAG TPA: branched-chain amino acid ABC transporter permease [Ktedonobacterales bacterium]|nr:branched-chain amino acid ABC transporter permease [Ktedonobacterales bacterium]
MTQIKQWANPGGLVALLLAAVVFPLVITDPTTTTITVFVLLFAAAATSWNIFSGYTGYIALGHAAYFGIGAYSLALICERWHIPAGGEPFYFVPLCGLIAGVFAIPFGAIALRTRRHTFVVITIATFFIMQLLAYNLHDLTHGSAGLDMPIPTQWYGSQFGLPPSAFYNLPFYYAALIVTLAALAVSWFVRHSKYGLGLLAIRDDEDRALGLGVKTGAFKLSAFVVSAIFVGMAGAIYAYFIGSVQPQFDFDALYDVAIALMVFMGGIGTLTGPILGAIVVEWAQQNLANIQITIGNTTLSGGGFYLILYGALFLVVILLLPQGVVPSARSLWNRWAVQRTDSAPPSASPATPLPQTTTQEEVRA